MNLPSPNLFIQTLFCTYNFYQFYKYLNFCLTSLNGVASDSQYLQYANSFINFLITSVSAPSKPKFVDILFERVHVCKSCPEQGCQACWMQRSSDLELNVLLKVSFLGRYFFQTIIGQFLTSGSSKNWRLLRYEG